MVAIIFLLVTFTISVVIFLQDYRNREVLAVLFLVLSITGLIYGVSERSGYDYLSDCLGNIILLTLQLLLVFCIIQFRGTGNFINNKIGIGDIFFLYACCFYFSPLNLIMFYVLSFHFALAMHFIFLKTQRYSQSSNSIALAGWQAIALSLTLAIGYVGQINLYDDFWILQYADGL